jgi:hypothetical protein
VANEYASLTEFKKARGVTGSSDDVALQAALTRASRAIDRKTGRRFWLDPAPVARVYGTTGRVTIDGLLLIDDLGDTTDLTVESGSGLSWTATTDYETRPDNAISDGEPVTALAAGIGYWLGPRVRLTGRWGWPLVPDEISQATLILANRLYMRKDTPEGVKGSAEWGAIRLSRWDPDVETLVGPYVLPGFA